MSQPASSVTGGYTCDVGDHPGVDNDDFKTIADLACEALANHHARPGPYELSTGKLGGKVLLKLTDRTSGVRKSIMLSTPDEGPVAADRLALAIAENVSVDKTQNADNVVGPETPPPVQRQVQAGVQLAASVTEGAGLSTSPSGGLAIDITFRLHRVEFLLQGRAGGVASASNATKSAMLGAGARYFFTNDDIAPFAGGGVSFGSTTVDQTGAASFTGSGFGFYGDVGYAFMRSSRAGAVVFLRADLPTYTLDQPNSIVGLAGATQYVVPISLNFGLMLH